MRNIQGGAKKVKGAIKKAGKILKNKLFRSTKLKKAPISGLTRNQEAARLTGVRKVKKSWKTKSSIIGSRKTGAYTSAHFSNLFARDYARYKTGL